MDYLTSGAADRLLRRGASHLTRIKSSHVHVTHESGPVRFSLDGEMMDETSLTADCTSGGMQFIVGQGYDPVPKDPSSSEW